MRTEFAALVLALALAGCATGRRTDDGPAAVGTSAGAEPCPAPGPGRGAEVCSLPADVRAFVADRELCDHFRGEPWPEGDSDADRERRRHLVDGARRECAGSDRRLAALKSRYAGNPSVMLLLSRYDERIED